jgi:hypothetical protein
MRSISWLAAGAVALAVGCASTDSTGPSTATATTPHPAATAAGSTASGGIQNYTTGPGGQQNGFVLASGQKVSFPESLGTKVSDQFPPNTQVSVTGHMTTDADGRSVLAADQISAPDRNVKLDLTALGASPTPSPTTPSIGGSGTAGTPPPTDTQSQPTSPTVPPPAGR